MGAEPSPFAGTAPYYRHRPPYAPEALEFVASAFDLGPRSRVLDLGCGPGTLAIPFAARAGEVVALDRDAGMIAEGRQAAQAQARSNIDWRLARAEDLSLALGRFRLAVLGQSFHWMDRDLVLRRLGEIIEDGGGLALVNPGPRRPVESWEPLADEVLAKFGVHKGWHPSASPERKHEPALLRSVHFSNFTVRAFGTQVVRDIPSVIGCVFSMSYASTVVLGAQAEAFRDDLAAALRDANPSGVFRETLETEVILAPKSA
jgi:SAM-dependent methyltransferase